MDSSRRFYCIDKFDSTNSIKTEIKLFSYMSIISIRRKISEEFGIFIPSCRFIVYKDEIHLHSSPLLFDFPTMGSKCNIEHVSDRILLIVGKSFNPTKYLDLDEYAIIAYSHPRRFQLHEHYNGPVIMYDTVPNLVQVECKTYVLKGRHGASKTTRTIISDHGYKVHHISKIWQINGKIPDEFDLKLSEKERYVVHVTPKHLRNIMKATFAFWIPVDMRLYSPYMSKEVSYADYIDHMFECFRSGTSIMTKFNKVGFLIAKDIGLVVDHDKITLPCNHDLIMDEIRGPSVYKFLLPDPGSIVAELIH